MSEKSKKELEKQESEKTNDAKSQDHETIQKIAGFVNSKELTQSQIEEKIDNALKVCYQMIEDMASNYIPKGAGFSKKMSDLKSKAKNDMFNRVLEQGVEDIETLTSAVAIDAVKEVVPVEDRAKKPISKEEIRQARISKYIEKSFNESMEAKKNDKVSLEKTSLENITYENISKGIDREEIIKAKENFAKNSLSKNMSSEELKYSLSNGINFGNSKEDIEMKRLADSYSTLAGGELGDVEKQQIIYEVSKLTFYYLNSGNENAAALLKNFDSSFGLGIFSKENGIESLDENKLFGVFLEYARDIGANEESLNSLLEDAKKDMKRTYIDDKKISEEISNTTQENMTQEEIDKLLQSMDSNTAEAKKTDESVMTQEAIDALVKKLQNEKSVGEKITDTFSKSDKDFNEEIEKIVSEDPIGAYQFLKDSLSSEGNQLAQNNQAKIMQLNGIINKVIEEKITDALTNEKSDIGDEARELSNLRPDLGQKALKSALENPENSNKKNFNNKALALQNELTEKTNENKDDKAKHGKFLSAEEIDISNLSKEAGVSIVGNNEKTSTQKEDDELSL